MVVVLVDDDTYYWVYLSSNHLFQVYYKVRQVLLQSATAIFITKCDGLLLQSATAFLLQSATAIFITKCDGLLLQSATAFLLQSATSVITKCDNFITKCDRYYKVRRLLQSATVHGPLLNVSLIRFVSYSQGLVYLLRDKFYSLNSSIHFKKNIDSLIFFFAQKADSF